MSIRFSVYLLPALILSACEPPPTPPPAPAKIPVTSEVLEMGPFRPTLTVLGRVEPAVRMDLRSQSGGRIRYAQRFAGGLRTGETVRRGEPLFDIDNDEVGLALAEAELTAEAANTAHDRARRGVEGGFLSPAELEASRIDAELAQKRLENARLQVERLRHSAPIAGVLEVDQTVAAGTDVRAEQLLARIAGGDGKRVEAWAAAADLDSLRPGLAAELLVSKERLVGRATLSEVAGRVDDDGTVRLVATVDEDLGLPAVGEGIEVRVLLASRSDAVTVPIEALLVDGGVARAFVLEPAGTDYVARLRMLSTGGRDGERIEILSGVRDGERIAVRGAEFLADGLSAVEAKRRGGR